MSSEEDDPFFQLSGEGDSSSQNDPTPPKKEDKPIPASNPPAEEDPFASLGGSTEKPKDSINLAKDKNKEEKNHDLHDDSLGDFTASSQAGNNPDDFFVHEDNHLHDDMEVHTQNDFQDEPDDDPLTKLGGGFMDFAKSSSGSTASQPSGGGFMNFANTGAGSSTASTSNQGGWSQNTEANQNQGGWSQNTQANQNQGAYGQQNPQNNLGSPLGTQQAQYTQNRYNEFQTNLQGSQNFMNQFQNNVSALQPNRGQYPPPVGNMIFDNVSYMSALGQKLYFKGERQKVSEEEKTEVEKKIAKITESIQFDIKEYRRGERIAKRWAFIFKFLSSALAAIVTVLLGINITDTLRAWGIDWWINFFALVISAFISLIGVFQSFYDSDQLWVKYTDTANKLERLLSTIEYVKLSGEYVNLNDVNSIKIEYDRIIESTHNYELQIRAENDETSDRITREGMTNQNGQYGANQYNNRF